MLPFADVTETSPPSCARCAPWPHCAAT